MSTYRDYIKEMYIHGFSLAEGEPTFRVPENFDKYKEGPGWEAYCGANDWENSNTGIAVYLNPEGWNKEMARIWFEVNYPPELEEAVDTSNAYQNDQSAAVKKWGDKAAKRWMRETINIRKSTRIRHGAHDGYFRDWVERKPWKECFMLALESEKMKPFVKKWGVDATKWVGMKRCSLNEVTEKESRFWWMEPNGEPIPVGPQGHSKTGRDILYKKFGMNQALQQGQIYNILQQKGYIRVGFTGSMGMFYIEINYNPNRPPSLVQWKALKDLAIEMGAGEISDNVSGKKVRVNESRLIFENFHENKEWFIYEGTNTLTAVFEDNSRETFKIHFHKNWVNEERDKVRKKAASTWKRLAMEIRNKAGLSKTGNPIIIPWQECFRKALQETEMKEYIDDLRAMPIFESYRVPNLNLKEMTYDDLMNSMKNYRSKSDIRQGKVTGADSRIEKAKKVSTRSLRVISTVGRDGEEHETSLFSYKTYGDGKPHQRHNGFIRFIENSKENSPVAPTKDKQDVEVNCTCEDYRYVFAQANAEHGAGETGKATPAGFTASGPVSRTAAQPLKFKSPEKPVNIFEDVPMGGSFKGGNEANPALDKGIRNPEKTPGLCIAKGELVSTDKGFIPIEQVDETYKVWTLNGWRYVKCHFKTGVKPVIEIKLQSGKNIKITPEHRVLTVNNRQGFSWIEAQKLTQDDFMVLTLPQNNNATTTMFEVSEYHGDKLYYPKRVVQCNTILAELLGYMVSEGSRGVFSNFNENINKDFYNKWIRQFGDASCILRKEGVYIGSHGDKILSKIGFVLGSYNKEVPNWIMRGRKEVVAAFLRGCYAGDGNFRNHHSTYASVSEKLCRQIQLLIEFLGVKTSLKCYESGINESPTWVVRTSSKEETEKLYRCLDPIRGYSQHSVKCPVQKHFPRRDYVIDDIRNFLTVILNKTVHFNGEDKTILLTECGEYFDWYSNGSKDVLAKLLKENEKLEKVRIKPSGKPNNAAKLSDIFSVLKPYYIRKTIKKLLKGEYKAYREYKTPVQRLRKIVDKLSVLSPETHEFVSLLGRSDVSFEKVVATTNVSVPIEVYDLKIEEVEHFTVNGMVVHNCKHLIALAGYLNDNVEPVAPAEPGKEEPSPVAPSVGKSNLKHTGKPMNIFESMKQFAIRNPQFEIQYED